MAINPTNLLCAQQLGLQNGLYDDFMYNAYGLNALNNAGNTQAGNPAFAGGLYAQPQADTFEREGSSPLSSGLKLGVIGGLGTGAGVYYLGNKFDYLSEKLGLKLLKDGKLNEDFINAIRKNNINEYKALKESRKIIESLKSNPAELAKHIEENAALYEIKGDEAAIKKFAEKWSKRPEDFLRINEQKINFRHLRYEQVKDLRAGKIGAVSSYIDKTKNVVKESAPQCLQKAFNNFKIKKAGKYGLIAAGVGIAIGWLLGGNKS